MQAPNTTHHARHFLEQLIRLILIPLQLIDFDRIISYVTLNDSTREKKLQLLKYTKGECQIEVNTEPLEAHQPKHSEQSLEPGCWGEEKAVVHTTAGKIY